MVRFIIKSYQAPSLKSPLEDFFVNLKTSKHLEIIKQSEYLRIRVKNIVWTIHGIMKWKSVDLMTLLCYNVNELMLIGPCIHMGIASELTPVAKQIPDCKVLGANMGPTWGLSAPDGPHVGPTNLAIRGLSSFNYLFNAVQLINAMRYWPVSAMLTTLNQFINIW